MSDQTPNAAGQHEGVNDSEPTREEQQTVTVTDTENDEFSEASTADEGDRES